MLEKGLKRLQRKWDFLGATALSFICMLKLVYYFEAEIEKK